MNDTFFDALFSIENYNDFERSIESMYTVKTAKDVLKIDDVKKKLEKLDKWRKSKGYNNVTNSTNFTKYEKGVTVKYSNLKSALFEDPETKIHMFRSCLKFIGTNMIKQKLKIKNQNYTIDAVFDNPKKNELVFKNVCNIKIKK